MSKKKDREVIDYRFCPVCGSKNIVVYTFEKFLKRKIIICCWGSCKKEYNVNKFSNRINFY